LRSSSRPLLISTVIYLAGGLSLPGCADELANAPAAVQFNACQPLWLTVDSDASPAERAGIVGAVDLWNGVAATRLALADDGDPSAVAAAAARLPVHFQRAAAPFHGLYDDGSVQIFINQDLDHHARVVAIAHEVGHAFGLVHVAPGERPSLMNSGNLTIDPTAGDVASLAARWGRCATPPSTAAP
jgi:hypothetical protein